MKRLTCLAVALLASFAIGNQEVEAQDFGGPGFQAYHLGGIGTFNGFNGFDSLGFVTRERPPFFALYPPVYYSDEIVRRPVGISPFAAPPGVRPVELGGGGKANSLTIKNPFFKPEAAKIADTITDLDSDT